MHPPPLLPPASRRRVVRVCAYCGAVACVVGAHGAPRGWVAPQRPAAAELRRLWEESPHVRPSHGICPSCFDAQLDASLGAQGAGAGGGAAGRAT